MLREHGLLLDSLAAVNADNVAVAVVLLDLRLNQREQCVTPLHKAPCRELYDDHVMHLHISVMSNCLKKASQGLSAELSANRMLLIHRAKARGQGTRLSTAQQ